MKNDALYNEKANIIGDYMELIAQFGFIALFSEVFPPASLFSFICNFIQMKSQINNFKYTRRFKAEVGNGIGSFMDCLQILTQLSIISNCALLFWTSKYFHMLFVSKKEDSNFDAKAINEDNNLAKITSIT
jgi:anoctamin-10